MTKTSPLSKFYLALVFIFLYAPMIVMMVFSFNGTESTYIFEGFSLQWYEKLFHDKVTMDALKNTVVLAVVSATIATVMGTLAAVGINAMKNKHIKSSVMTVTNIPMMNPEIVTGISMMLLFVFAGAMFNKRDVLGFWTILIAHVTFQLPYVILSILPKLKQTDNRIFEAAQDLGASPAKTFIKVTLPLSMKGVMSGIIMVFLPSATGFAIPQIIGNGDINLIGNYIERYFVSGGALQYNTGALVSVVIIVIVLGSLFLITKIDEEGDTLI